MGINEIYKKVNELGVSNPNNPTKEDFKVLMESFINKKIDPEVFTAYLFIKDLDPKDLISGMKDLMSNSKDISKAQMDLCDKAIDIFKDSFNKADTPEEREQIRQGIFNILNLGREESESFKKTLVMGLAIVASVFVGGKFLLKTVKSLI